MERGAAATRQLATNLDEYCKHLQLQSEQQRGWHLSPSSHFPSDGKCCHISTIGDGSVRSICTIERYVKSVYVL